MAVFGLLVLQSLYFMLPAYFANMAPVIVKRLNLFATPIDFNMNFGNKPLFGKNKTFRGFIFGVIFAVIMAYAQYLLSKLEFFANISLVNYQNWLLFGFLMGFGALTGDLAKSFFKRRLDIKPGDSFFPFDQIDFVIGAFIFAAPLIKITFTIFLTSLILSFMLGVMVNHIAFYLRIRSERW